MKLIDWLLFKERCGIIMQANDQMANLMLSRLKDKIELFREFEGVTDYEVIKNNREKTELLQQAYDIMYNAYHSRIYRCEPCEMEALCAINQILIMEN